MDYILHGYWKLWLILFAACLNGITPSSAQNLFPNPDFENYLSCPTGYDQINKLSDWSSGNTASPDYFNCTFTGTSAQAVPSQGSGVIGLWGGANHPSCPGSGFAENIVANLTQTLTPGKLYDLAFDVQIDGNGTMTNAPNACMDLGFYFYESANPPNLSNSCCPSVWPQISIPAQVLIQGSYIRFTSSLIATANWDRVLISPMCNTNTTDASCAVYATNKLYYNLDNVSLQEAAILDLQPNLASKNPPESAIDFSIFPNPASDHAILQVDLPVNDRIRVSCTDMAGRIVWKEAYDMQVGKQEVVLPISQLSKGIYHIKVLRSNAEVKYLTFVVN